MILGRGNKVSPVRVGALAGLGAVERNLEAVWNKFVRAKTTSRTAGKGWQAGLPSSNCWSRSRSSPFSLLPALSQPSNSDNVWNWHL
jgi:hypothetical protein